MSITRDTLQKLNRYEEAAKRFDGVKRLFVDTTTPEMQKAFAALTPKFIEVEGIDVSKLREEYYRRQTNYDTAPFDPEGRQFRMFPGGVTIWSGFPGSGKTTLLRQLACHLLHKGRGVFVASLEEQPDDMLFRLMQTAAGTEQPSEHQCQWMLDAYGERLRIWGMVGIAKVGEVLATIVSLADKGIRHAIIDSLTCLDVGSGDWEGQRMLANQLVSVARATGTHIHLVAHPRKPSAGQSSPDIADIAGSSDLGRLVDNVLFVRRSTDESLRYEDATPMMVMVRKQRHGTGMCGEITGWFHRTRRQFSELQRAQEVIRYLPENAYEAA